jgi:hypothetical protein
MAYTWLLWTTGATLDLARILPLVIVSCTLPGLFLLSKQLLTLFIHRQRFYSVYDTTNSQVGFATTEYTTTTSN